MTSAGRGLGRAFISSGKWHHTISPAVGSAHHFGVMQIQFGTSWNALNVFCLEELVS